MSIIYNYQRLKINDGYIYYNDVCYLPMDIIVDNGVCGLPINIFVSNDIYNLSTNIFIHNDICGLLTNMFISNIVYGLSIDIFVGNVVCGLSTYSVGHITTAFMQHLLKHLYSCNFIINIQTIPTTQFE